MAEWQRRGGSKTEQRASKKKRVDSNLGQLAKETRHGVRSAMPLAQIIAARGVFHAQRRGWLPNRLLTPLRLERQREAKISRRPAVTLCTARLQRLASVCITSNRAANPQAHPKAPAGRAWARPACRGPPSLHIIMKEARTKSYEGRVHTQHELTRSQRALSRGPKGQPGKCRPPHVTALPSGEQQQGSKAEQQQHRLGNQPTQQQQRHKLSNQQTSKQEAAGPHPAPSPSSPPPPHPASAGGNIQFRVATFDCECGVAPHRSQSVKPAACKAGSGSQRKPGVAAGSRQRMPAPAAALAAAQCWRHHSQQHYNYCKCRQIFTHSSSACPAANAQHNCRHDAAACNLGLRHQIQQQRRQQQQHRTMICSGLTRAQHPMAPQQRTTVAAPLGLQASAWASASAASQIQGRCRGGGWAAA